MTAFIAKNPVCTGGESVQQPFGAQEVHVGEGSEKEAPFDAGRKADEVQQKLPAMFACLELIEFLNGVHPLHAEVCFLCNGRDLLDGGKRGCALVRLGNIIVKQGEIEMYMHCLFEELARKIEPGLGRVDVPVEIENEVIRND